MLVKILAGLAVLVAGLAVVIARRECIQTAKTHKK